MRQNEKRDALMTTAILLIAGAILAVSATYAWLGVSRIPFVSNVSVTVTADAALSIAPDNNGVPGEWGPFLDMSAYLKDRAPLRPVTYASDSYYKVVYEDSGRTDGVVPLDEGDIYVFSTASSAVRATAGEDGLESDTYMIAIPFWMQCEGSVGRVRLAEAVQTADDQMGGGTYVVGSPHWDQDRIAHTNGGHGSETALRMGFECTPTDSKGKPLKDAKTTFTMYEPNADTHHDGTEGILTTRSVNGGELIATPSLAIQKSSYWKEQDPVLQDNVDYIAAEFVQNPEICRMNKTGMQKCTLYIWMEGQDYDCIAAAVDEEVELSIQVKFATDADEVVDTGIQRR